MLKKLEEIWEKKSVEIDNDQLVRNLKKEMITMNGPMMIFSMLIILIGLFMFYVLSKNNRKINKKLYPFIAFTSLIIIISGCSSNLEVDLNNALEKNDQLTEELTSLEENHSDLLEKSDEIEKNNKELIKEISQLEGKNKNLQDNLDILQAENKESSAKIKTLRNDKEQLQIKLKETQTSSQTTSNNDQASQQSSNETANNIASTSNSTDDCNIKGSKNGIYHVPGSTYYNRTKNVVQWFCSVNEAENAGYRAPKK